MRTYSGHSTAAASNQLYRTNLAKGQTGLSIAFDLPTQTGYDPDSPMAVGEVGKVGVPVVHLGHMRTLLDGIPPGQMNTSMTINATAAWLLALYVANAEEQGTPSAELRGTTQNDIVKEYLSRGHVHLPARAVAPADRRHGRLVRRARPAWNPMNVCSYHLQEAGATPVQELAYALATAIGVLDAVRDSGQVPPERFGQVFGSISFFVNAGIRFVEEICKLRAFTEMWDRIGLERYGVDGPQGAPLPLRRAGQQPRPHRGAAGEQRPAHRARDARRDDVEAGPGPQHPAAGVERGARPAPPVGPAVVVADATGAGVRVRPARVRRPVRRLARRREAHRRAARRRRRTSSTTCWRWAARSRPSTTLKSRLVSSMAERTRRIESGEQVVVGVNRFTETEPSPLGGDGRDPARRPGRRGGDDRRRRARGAPAATTPRSPAALDELRRAAASTATT